MFCTIPLKGLYVGDTAPTTKKVHPILWIDTSGTLPTLMIYKHTTGAWVPVA